MVHILLGENTPSRATVQTCINFNASYTLRNLKKKKSLQILESNFCEAGSLSTSDLQNLPVKSHPNSYV